MKLFESFYAYPWQGSDNNCNSCVLAGVLDGGKHVLVDPGHLMTPSYRESGLNRLLGSMRRDGLEAESIGLVILTHSHPDHSESAIALRDKYQVLVAMHQADEPAYSALGGKADIFLNEGDLKLGTERPVVLRVYHSPGHTPGHITLFWPDKKALIAGDCIFYRSVGRADLPGGDFLTLGRSIEKLSALDIEYLVCGHPYGHTGIITGTEDVQDNFRFIRNLFY